MGGEPKADCVECRCRALGIAGAFVATFIGQAVGWYRPDQGAGFIAATVGAIVVLFPWNRFSARRGL